MARTGASRIAVARRIRSVAPAAAARAMSGSWFGYTMRSIVPSVEKPRASARLAHSSTSRPAPGIVDGSPMPTSMTPNRSCGGDSLAVSMSGRRDTSAEPYLGDQPRDMRPDMVIPDVIGRRDDRLLGAAHDGVSRHVRCTST